MESLLHAVHKVTAVDVKYEHYSTALFVAFNLAVPLPRALSAHIISRSVVMFFHCRVVSLFHDYLVLIYTVDHKSCMLFIMCISVCMQTVDCIHSLLVFKLLIFI